MTGRGLAEPGHCARVCSISFCECANTKLVNRAVGARPGLLHWVQQDPGHWRGDRRLQSVLLPVPTMLPSLLLFLCPTLLKQGSPTCPPPPGFLRLFRERGVPEFHAPFV